METNQASDSVIIYVITEREELELLPTKCSRILVTAELDPINSRFAKRMGGQLPKPVSEMIERKHHLFDDIDHITKINTDKLDIDLAVRDIVQAISE